MMTENMLKILIAGSILFLSAVAPIGCGRDDRRAGAPAVAIDSAGPDQVTSQAHIYLYNQGRKTTDLRANQIQQYTAKDSTLAFDLDVDFFDSTGVKISSLKARKGYIREKDNFLAVNGSVVVVREDSARMFTEYLMWDAARDRVDTDSFVTFIHETDTIRSYGVITDSRLQDITFKRKVSGRLTDMEKIRNDQK